MLDSIEMENFDLGDGTGFTYSAAALDFDEAPEEMTLVTITADDSGSVGRFAAELTRAIKDGVMGLGSACPHVNQLWLRATTFEGRSVDEAFGFKLFADIDPASDFPAMRGGGATPLIDATLEGLSVMGAEAARLNSEDVMANGILIVITDGGENSSSNTMEALKAKVTELVDSHSRSLESLKVYLVGVNAASYQAEHEDFMRELGLDPAADYKLIENFDEKAAGRLAGWISQSVSAQAAAAGTGGPSQSVAF